jgi:hypothetical protein
MSEEIKQSPLNQAAKDKFLLVFDLPPILKTFSKTYERNNSTVLPDNVQFSIWGTSVPEITVPGVETRYAGSTLYVSSHSKNSYPPVSIDFAIDDQYNNYWCIYQWLNLMHDQKTGQYDERQVFVDANFNDYQTDITVYGLDEYGKKKIKFVYKKAFPTTLKGIEYNYQATGDMRITSGFVFLYSQLHVELID